jgi:hypothetical protein
MILYGLIGVFAFWVQLLGYLGFGSSKVALIYDHESYSLIGGKYTYGGHEHSFVPLLIR